MSENMSENMSDENQNNDFRHRDGNLNKEHKKAEVTAKTVKKKFNPVTVFCVCSLAIIVLMTICYEVTFVKYFFSDLDKTLFSV